MTGSTPAARNSRALIIAALLVSIVGIGTVSILPTARSQSSAPVTFYLHRQSSKVVNQMTGTLWANTTQLWSVATQQENRDVRSTQQGIWEIYSQPSSPGILLVAAPVSFNVWLSATTTITGASIIATLLSVSPAGSKTILGTVTLIQDITTTSTSHVLTISSLSSPSIPSGYILEYQITVDVTGGSLRTVTLWFDSSTSPSSILVTLADHVETGWVRYYNTSLTLTSSFSRNWSLSDRQVVSFANITDSLGLYDISQVRLTVTSPTGSTFLNGTLMTQVSGLDTSYEGLWQLSFPYSDNDPSGTYRARVTIRDRSSNLRQSAEFNFQLFAVWPLRVSVSVPPGQTPFSGVEVRALDGAVTTWSTISDSQGVANGYARDDRVYRIESYWQSSLVGSFSTVNVNRSTTLPMSLQMYRLQISTILLDGDGRSLNLSSSTLTLTAPNGTRLSPDPNIPYYLQTGTFRVEAVTWNGVNVAPSGASFDPSNPLAIRLRVYDLSIIVTGSDGTPLADAQVAVSISGGQLASGVTDSSGLLFLSQLPGGELAVSIQHSSGQTTQTVSHDKTQTVTLQVTAAAPATIPLSLFAIAIGAGIAGFSGLLAFRRVERLKFKERGFTHFNRILGGDIPKASAILIMGESGSGKSLLCEQLTSDWLKKGGSCVYITYSTPPDEIRNRIQTYGATPTVLEQAGRLAIVDCYSAQSKTKSNEKYLSENPFDLTTLGIKLSQALRDTGEKEPLVVIEPLSVLFTKVNADVVASFLQDKAAKVKSLGGRLVFTIVRGTLPKEVAGKMEALADGIIDLAAVQGKEGITRTLAIRKMMGSSYKEGNFEFRIKPRKGIFFRTRRNLPWS